MQEEDKEWWMRSRRKTTRRTRHDGRSGRRGRGRGGVERIVGFRSESEGWRRSK